MENKVLTYQEFMELALKNYCKGGMVFFECWEEYQFDDYCKEYGAITQSKAMQLFKRGY